MTLPEDPMMLFSVINMKLRDNYSSLDELTCILQNIKIKMVNHANINEKGMIV